MNKLTATSKILYLRASIKPLRPQLTNGKSIIDLLHEKIDFEELVAPHFQGARAIWKPKPTLLPKPTHSGMLGKIIAATNGSVVSSHPSHAFAGIGNQVADVLYEHNHKKPCFFPISELADRHDFSMLLLGCTKESPGFSTVHTSQYKLGLSQKHILRFLLRWDYEENGIIKSMTPPELPGCSASFDKFYPYYESTNNVIRGSWGDAEWIFVRSAREAIKAEMKLLKDNGRFVDCKSPTCPTCKLRLY